MKTLVMKFGGAAVASTSHFAHVADLIIERHQTYSSVVVVVSAMGQTTNQLIDLALQVHPQPPQREYDMLISVGERISMSLLAMALWRKGQEAVSFTGSQSGILTCSQHSQAKIQDVRPYRLTQALAQGKIVIVAGFQGVNQEKDITTLGRGGSDTSAVALGAALGTEKVEFFKDVPGICDRDPKQDAQAVCFSQMTYQDALSLVNQGAKVLHPRAIQLAAKNGVPLQVRSFIPSMHDHEGTWIVDAGRKRLSVPLYEVD